MFRYLTVPERCDSMKLALVSTLLLEWMYTRSSPMMRSSAVKSPLVCAA